MADRAPAHVLLPADIAARWQCDVETVYSLIRRGALQAFTTSPSGSKKPRWRVLVSVVEAFENGQKQETAPPPSAPRPKKTNVKHYFR